MFIRLSGTHANRTAATVEPSNRFPNSIRMPTTLSVELNLVIVAVLRNDSHRGRLDEAPTVESCMPRLVRMTLIGAAAILGLALSMPVVTSTQVQAGASTGTWRNGMQAGPGGVGCYNRGCAVRNYARPAPSYRRSSEYGTERRYRRSSGYGRDRGYHGHREYGSYRGYRSYRGPESYSRDRY